MRLEDLAVEHRHVQVDGCRFHYVEKGSGPPVLLLHGFPEHWWSWRYQIDPLVQAGFRVLAPDLRGYNESCREGPYHLDRLTADVAGLLAAAGERRAAVVGHDWGGGLAWHLAATRPELCERLVVLNCPHPAQMQRALRGGSLGQMKRSWYIFLFQLPFLPEYLLTRHDALLLRRMYLREAKDRSHFGDEDIAPFRAAIQLPGAASATIGWYRAFFRAELPRRRRAGRRPAIGAPTLLIWGMEDGALGYADLVPGTERHVPSLRVEQLEGCGHFVHAERPERVNPLLIDFLRAGGPPARMAGCSSPRRGSLPLAHLLGTAVVEADLRHRRIHSLETSNDQLRAELDGVRLCQRDEETLHRRRALAELMFKHSVASQALLDRHFDFIKVNELYARASGHDVSFFPGKNHFDIFPSDAKTIFEQVVETKQPYQAIARPFTYPDRPDEVTYWNWNLAPILDDQGEVDLLLLSLNDVTALKQAELEIRQLNEQLEERVQERTRELRDERNFITTVLDTQEALVVVLDRDGRIIRFNRACGELTGFSQSEMVGRSVVELLPPEQREHVGEVFASLLAGQFPNTHENDWVTRSGERRLIAWSNNAIVADGRVQYVIGTGIDITESRRAEAELERLNQELLIKERLATLGRLTTTVGHELRNPLSTVRNSLVLVRALLPERESRLQQALDRADRGVTRCDSIINDLLDFTRAGQLQSAPVRLDEWLASVLEEQAIPQGVKVAWEPGAPGVEVAIDVGRMRRAVVNVVENACQAITGPQKEGRGMMTVSTRVTGGRVELSVADTGPGIPAEVLPRIFEPLFSTKSFGVGLGLAIVKNVLEQHGGGVEVASTPGSGARFVLWLPAPSTEERS